MEEIEEIKINKLMLTTHNDREKEHDRFKLVMDMLDQNPWKLIASNIPISKDKMKILLMAVVEYETEEIYL